MSPRRLSAKSGGELATKTNPATGVEQPLSTSYQASVPIPTTPTRSSASGSAAGPRSTWTATTGRPLGQRFWRFLTRTFHFRM